MKIKYKDKDLLESETFITFGMGETELLLEDKTESIRLILNFVDTDEKKHDLQFEVIDSKTAKLNLINFKEQFGMGIKEPVSVGTFKKRKLYFIFHVKPTGAVANCRVVTFSFYLGEEVQDGQD